MAAVGRSITLEVALPDFTFAVGEKRYSLRYDFAAFRAYEKATGVNPLAADFRLTSENLGSFLFAGLRSRHPEIEEAAVLSWLTPRNATPMLQLAMDAWAAAFPEPAAVTEEKTDPPSA